MKNSTVIIIFAIVAIAGLSYLALGDLLDRSESISIGAVTQTSQVSNLIFATSTIPSDATTAVFAINSDRIYSGIVNIGANNVWCDNSTPVTDSGWLITPSSSLEFGVDYIPYTGAVACIGENSTGTISYITN